MKISGAERAAAAALPVPGRASRSKKISARQRRGSIHDDARPRSTRRIWSGPSRDRRRRRGNDRSAFTSSPCSAVAPPFRGRAPRSRKRRRAGSRAINRRGRSPFRHRARVHTSANRRGNPRPSRRPRSWSFPAIPWGRSRGRISRRLSWEGATAAGWRAAEATSWIPLLRGEGAGGDLVWEVGKRRRRMDWLEMCVCVCVCMCDGMVFQFGVGRVWVPVRCLFFEGWRGWLGLLGLDFFPFANAKLWETNN